MNCQRFAVLCSVFVMIASSAIPATAQPTPRTAWGDPDLGGIWDYRTITPMQRPEKYADQEFLTEEEVAALEQGRWTGRSPRTKRRPFGPRSAAALAAATGSGWTMARPS